MTVLTKTLRAGLLSGLIAVLPVVLTPAWLCAAADSFPLEKGDICLGCHDDLIAKKHKHPAIEDSDSCTACHELANPAVHAPSRPGKNVGELCLGCHDAFAGKGSTHGPMAAGECTACHDPHGSDQPKLLRQAQPQLCFGCHDKDVEDDQGKLLTPINRIFEDKKAVLHPPFEDGECTVCHQPHASAQQRLLVEKFPKDFYATYSDAAYGLCLTCHDSEAFNQPLTLTATGFRNGNLNLHYRHVNKEKGRACRACHNPHGTRQKHLIAAGFVFGKKALPITYTPAEDGGSCQTACHGKADYNRVLQVFTGFRTTPRKGQDATPEALQAQPEATEAAKAEPETKEEVKAEPEKNEAAKAEPAEPKADDSTKAPPAQPEPLDSAKK